MKKSIILAFTIVFGLIVASGCSEKGDHKENLLSQTEVAEKSMSEESQTDGLWLENESIAEAVKIKMEDLTIDPLADEEMQNLSSEHHYSAYASKTFPDLVYIERNPSFRTEISFPYASDRFVIDMNGPSPIDIIQKAEEEFAGKVIKYHCSFVGRTNDPFEAISQLLSVELKSTGTSSAEAYLTKNEIDTLRESGIGNVVMDFELLDMERFKTNFPDMYRMLSEPVAND